MKAFAIPATGGLSTIFDVRAKSDQHVTSSRYSGLGREANDGSPAESAKIGLLEKPISGRDGWRVAGIQQVR